MLFSFFLSNICLNFDLIINKKKFNTMKKINTQLLRFRKTYFLILFGFIFNNCKLIAQDKITLLNGTEIISKIKEINETQVNYKLFDNQNGPDRILFKKDIFSIKYENGKIEVFNSGNLNSQTQKDNSGSNLIADNSKFDSDKSDFAKKRLKKFEGPRIGFTYIHEGIIRDYLESINKDPNRIMQFGYQFETRLFTADDGTSALLEFIPMIGGIDQGLFLPSISILTGLRNATDAKISIEFALGPNFSISRDYKKDLAPSVGLVIGFGTNIKKSNINFPINVVFVPSVGGVFTDKNKDFLTQGKKQDGKLIEATNPAEYEHKYNTGWKLSIIVGFNSRRN